MLRNRLTDDLCQYADPILGIDLRVSQQDLKDGQASLTQNCVWDGGVRKRWGQQTLTSVSQGAYRGTGGIRMYSGTNRRRLASWNTGVFMISDLGAINTVTNGLTGSADVHFTPWSITDAMYVANGSDILGVIDNTFSYASVTGTNVPSSPVQACAFRDRLFAIQGEVVVTSNPRSDSVWANASSSWAAYQPTGSAGAPKALHVHSRTGQIDQPSSMLLIFQRGSVSALEGTDFGTDVTAASPTTGWDASLRVVDPRIGTESPYSVCTVPGLGTFWFTQDNNIAWLSFDSQLVRYVGDTLIALNRNDVYGIDSVNSFSRSHVVMVYHHRYLRLFIPVNAEYPTTEYRLDVRALQNSPDRGFVWYGPMLGPTPSRLWVEDQMGDAEQLMSLEGNPLNGMWCYQADVKDLYEDAIGGQASAVAMVYETPFGDFGTPTMEKRIALVRVDGQGQLDQVTVQINDVHDADLAGSLVLKKVDGSDFSYVRYGSGATYGAGYHYGTSSASQLGTVFLLEQTEDQPVGDRLALRLLHDEPSGCTINALSVQGQVRKRQPVG